jgi:hypothetical protein
VTPSGDDKPPTADGDEVAPAPNENGRAGRRWLIAGLVVAGLAAALLLGYTLGGNNRDDDVKSAEAQAAKADKDAASANNDADDAEAALKEDQAQDEQAVDAISNGIDDLGNAVEEEDAKDDKAAEAAVDQATKDIESGLGQLGATLSENVDKALADLSANINDAVGSRTAENPQGDGG